MIHIRNAQLERFDEVVRQRFVAQLAGLLRRRYPDLDGRDEAALRAEVDSACRAASRYGLTAEHAVGDFVDLTYQIGPRFHEHPSVQRLLSDAAVPADRRIASLLETLTPAEWADVRRFAGRP